MNYRLLLPEEWPRLEGLIPAEFIPSPQASFFAIAEDDSGQILGVLPLQLQWHMEPIVIKDRRVNFLRLKEVLDNQLRAHPGSCYYAFAETEQVGRMAELAGLNLMPYLTFRGGV